MALLFGNWNKGGVPGLPPQPYLEWDARRPEDFDGTNWNATSRSKLRSGVPTIMNLVNGAVYSQANSCIRFDGTNDYGQCNLTSINPIFTLYSDFSATSNKFTSEVWAWGNPVSTILPYQPPIFSKPGNLTRWLQNNIIPNNTSGGAGIVRCTAGVFSNPEINVNPWENRWWHIISTVDVGSGSSNQINIYVNGVASDSANYGDGFSTTPDNVRLGFNNSGFTQNLDGAIGYFALYDDYIFTLENAFYRYNAGTGVWNSNNDPNDDGSRIRLTTEFIASTTLIGSANGSYQVDWGDGTSQSSSNNNLSHNFSGGFGEYIITITPDIGSTYRLNYNSNGNGDDITTAALFGSDRLGNSLQNSFLGCNNLTSISIADASKFTNINAAWDNCTSLTSFQATSFPSGTSFTQAWRNCTSLTSFPAISFPNGTNFNQAWIDCSSLTSFPLISVPNGTTFNGTWIDCSSLTSFPAISFTSGTDFTQAWNGCTNLTSFSAISVPNGTNFTQAWNGCTSLTSFPAISFLSGTNFTTAWFQCTNLTSFQVTSFPSGTNFGGAWFGCSSLTSFQTTSFPNATDLGSAWTGCSSLTSFPLISVPNVSNFSRAWENCTSLTSFPAVTFTSGTNFSRTWEGCTNLTTFPLTSFPLASNFTRAWFGCNLSAASIENILVAIDNNGQNNGTLGIDGGGNAGQSSWSPTANTAFNSLQSKGWTISANP